MFFRRMKRPDLWIRFVRKLTRIEGKSIRQRVIHKLRLNWRIVETEKWRKKRRGKWNPGTVFQMKKIGQIIAFRKIVLNFVHFCKESLRIPILFIKNFVETHRFHCHFAIFLHKSLLFRPNHQSLTDFRGFIHISALMDPSSK